MTDENITLLFLSFSFYNSFMYYRIYKILLYFKILNLLQSFLCLMLFFETREKYK